MRTGYIFVNISASTVNTCKIVSFKAENMINTFVAFSGKYLMFLCTNTFVKTL